MTKSALCAGWLVALFIVITLGSGVAAARDADPASLREADKHFQQGVTFYSEADYAAALVEFNRAYALAPNNVVLFNVGETQYQLRDYAAALATFERFLADAPSNDGHRALAESNLKELRGRVGRLTIATVPTGVEISVGDRVIGKSPIDNPVVVGVGQVTVKGTAPGRSTVVRVVEVAAEDDISMLLELPVLPPSAKGVGVASVPLDAGGVPAPARGGGAGWRVAGWVFTGLLAGGAATYGLLARRESSRLQTERGRYPADAGTLKNLSDRTNLYSVLADSMTAGAIVLGGITLYATLTAHKDGPTASLSVGPSSVNLALTF